MPLFDVDHVKPFSQLNDQEKELLKKIQSSCNTMIEVFDRICMQYGITYYLAYGNLLGAVRHGEMIPWDDDLDVLMYPSEYEKLKEHMSEFGKDYQLVEPSDFAPYYVDNVPRIMYLPSHSHDNEDRAKKLKGLMEHVHLDIFLLASLPSNSVVRFFYRYTLIFLYALGNAHRCHIPFEEYNCFQKCVAGFFICIGKFIPATSLLKWVNCLGKHYEGQKDNKFIMEYNAACKIMFLNHYREDFSETINLKYGALTVKAPIGYDRVLKIIYGDYMKIPEPDKQLTHVAMDSFTFDEK